MHVWTWSVVAAAITLAAMGCHKSEPSDDTDVTDTDGGDTDVVDTDVADTDVADTDVTACDAIPDRTFASLEELECGLGPDGVVLCHWQLTFDADGSWTWQHSDYGESGTWTCADGVVTSTGPSNYTGTYNPGTDTLTWDGHDYQ